MQRETVAVDLSGIKVALQEKPLPLKLDGAARVLPHGDAGLVLFFFLGFAECLFLFLPLRVQKGKFGVGEPAHGGLRAGLLIGWQLPDASLKRFLFVPESLPLAVVIRAGQLPDVLKVGDFGGPDLDVSEPLQRFPRDLRRGYGCRKREDSSKDEPDFS